MTGPADVREHRITIFVNNKGFETNEKEMTGAQIKALAKVPDDYELFRVEGDHTVPVGSDETVKAHNNQHFRAIPAGTFGHHGNTTATRA
jgi:hypothetical protein